MATTPDSLVVTGPVLQQISLSGLYITPTGGTQNTLANLVNGGTVAQTSGNYTIPTLANFSSITPAGSNLATATLVTALTTQVGAAASTTGIALPLSTGAGVLGSPLLLLNTGTAAIHVYGSGGDTIDGTAGTTGVTLTNAHRCFFTATASGAYVSGPEGGVTS